VAPKVASLYRLRFSWSLGSLAGTEDCEFATVRTNRTQLRQIIVSLIGALKLIHILRTSRSLSLLAEGVRFRAATDAVAPPQLKPRAVCVPLVVPSVRCRELTGIQGSGVRHGEDTLQRLDFT